ncbi:MAG: YfiR family protein [Candidatus Aminicenantes bacterium]|nr:MAG: YfiR family protein [Candidatus Aminicenantes bacterium]
MKDKLAPLVIALVVLSAYGAAQEVPFNVQAKLMLKIICMDRNINRLGSPIKIGVSSDKLLKELEGVKGLKIKGKDFLAKKIFSLDDIANYKVIYVGTNWSSNYLAASAKAVENRCLMFCEDETGVLNGGAAVSFKVVEGKPKIVVNLENAKKQGTDFPAGFLKITVVVGGLQ